MVEFRYRNIEQIITIQDSVNFTTGFNFKNSFSLSKPESVNGH